MLRFHKLLVMKRIIRLVFLCFSFLLINPTIASAAVNDDVSDSTTAFDWTPVMNAIIKVESEGNPRAKSGNSVGAMQITPILVAECNQILKRRKSTKRFKLSDRFSIAKSKEMFLLIQ